MRLLLPLLEEVEDEEDELEDWVDEAVLDWVDVARVDDGAEVVLEPELVAVLLMAVEVEEAVDEVLGSEELLAEFDLIEPVSGSSSDPPSLMV